MTEIKKSRMLTASQVARVNAVFRSLGYNEITPTDDAPGCYVSEILDQYRVDFSDDQILAIVRYAMCSTMVSIAAAKLSLREIMSA